MKVLIAILGSFNSSQGDLHPMAYPRIEKAIELSSKHSQSYLVVTGGFGYFNKSSTAHFQLVEEELVKRGISRDKLLAGLPSRNTVEDAVMIRDVFLEHGFEKLIAITSEYHRVRCLAIFADIMAGHAFEILGVDNQMDNEELEPYYKKEVLRLEELVRQGGVVFEI